MNAASRFCIPHKYYEILCIARAALYCRRRDTRRPLGRRFAKLDLGKISNRSCVVTQFAKRRSVPVSTGDICDFLLCDFLKLEPVRREAVHRFWFPSGSRDVRGDTVLFESRAGYPKTSSFVFHLLADFHAPRRDDGRIRVPKFRRLEKKLMKKFSISHRARLKIDDSRRCVGSFASHKFRVPSVARTLQNFHA